MSNDLLFSVLPREGKVAVEPESLRVKKVDKDATLRPLNDEEKQLNAEERDAREKYQGKEQQGNARDKSAEESPSDEVDPELPTIDDQGHKHLDIYI